MMTWFEMYNEFIKNLEKVNQLQRDYITNLELINYLYNESIKSIERVNDLYNQSIRNYEKMSRSYEQQFENNIDGYTYQLGYLNPIPDYIKYEMQIENIDCRD